MEQNIENKQDFKDKFINYFKAHIYKIYALIILIIFFPITFLFIEKNNERKNILISEKFIKAGLYLSANKKNLSKETYEEIILSKNKFYSILALNEIVEKDLISDHNKVIEYFDLLENSVTTKNQKDLVVLKKALYKIKNSNIQKGEILLKKLIDDNSILKPLALELIKN